MSNWIGLGGLELAGHDLLEVFSDVSPGLDYLANEVGQGGKALVEIAVNFRGLEDRNLLADVAPGGLDDMGLRQVLFFFSSPPAGLARKHEPVSRYGLVGNSAGMLEVFRKIEIYAAAEASVVVTGETGTGKELVARALHEQVAGVTGLSLQSTVLRFPRNCWSQNCSATRRGLLPGR
jgi:hypothetical protein